MPRVASRSRNTAGACESAVPSGLLEDSEVAENDPVVNEAEDAAEVPAAQLLASISCSQAAQQFAHGDRRCRYRVMGSSRRSKAGIVPAQGCGARSREDGRSSFRADDERRASNSPL